MNDFLKKSKNQQIIFAIEDYLNEKNTDYAVMISGEWGSGKTYFFNNTIIPEIKKQEWNVVELSLFGIKTAGEIYSSIFIESLNYLKNVREKAKLPWVQKVSAIYEAIQIKISDLPIIGKIPIQINTDQLFKNLLLQKDSEELKRIVIVFDDFERSGVDISECLGVISEFTTLGVKVFVIANDQEVKRIGEYEKLKEKVIRRTLYFTPDFEEYFEGIILKNVLDKSLQKYLIKNKNKIYNFFIDSEECVPENLRTIRESLRIVDKAYNIFEENIIDLELLEKVIVERFLGIFLFCSILKKFGEKRATFTSEDYTELMRLKDKKRSECSKEEIENLSIYDLMMGNIGKLLLFAQPSILDFIFKGYLDSKQLKKEILRYYGKDLIMLEKIKNWTECKDENEVIEIENFFWEKVESKEISIHFIAQILDKLILLSQSGIIKRTEKEMEKKIIDNINFYISGNREVNLAGIGYGIIRSASLENIMETFAKEVNQRNSVYESKVIREYFFDEYRKFEELEVIIGFRPLKINMKDIVSKIAEKIKLGDMICLQQLAIFLRRRYAESKIFNPPEDLSDDIIWLKELQEALLENSPIDKLHLYRHKKLMERVDLDIKYLEELKAKQNKQ